jgi:inorganic pyrophosphatase
MQKYALEPKMGIIAFHSVLPKKLEWPYDYGFIPQTLGKDGDGLDIVVINENGLFSGCLIAVRVIGAVGEVKDGVEDDRVIAVPLPSQGAPLPTDKFFDIADVPKAEIERIKSFLVEYPAFAGHDVKLTAMSDAKETMSTIGRGIKRFHKKN